MWTIFHTEASLGWGGQEIRILKESLGMKGRGHRVVIIAQEDSLLLKNAREAGLETIALSFRRKDYPGTLLSLLKLIRDRKPDFIVTHSSRDSWLGGVASKVSRHRAFVIRTRHISTPVAPGAVTSLLYNRLADRIVTTAEAIREELIDTIGVEPGRIVSIPTGVDTEAFDPGIERKDLRNELGLPAGTPLAGTVSVLRSWKGHDYFVEAAAIVSKRVPGARFVIAGDGPRRDEIRRIIDEKGLSGKVFMLGHRDDVPGILSSLDVLVQPSYANEGVPQSLIQAMAMEVPIVASDLKPFREIIRDSHNGLLVPPKDPEALAIGIERLLGDRDLRTRLGRNGRRLVIEKFSIDRMLDATEELYGEVIRSSGSAGDKGWKKPLEKRAEALTK